MAALFQVGVLALQGGFKEIVAAVARQPNVVASEVRNAAELAAVDALILPGGESTTIGRLLELSDLMQPLRDFVLQAQKPVFGVCAGLVLLSKDVVLTAPGADGEAATRPADQPLVHGLDVTVSRNHFGRQSQSRYVRMSLTEAGQLAELGSSAHFVRAPAVVRTAEDVTVLALSLIHI